VSASREADHDVGDHEATGAGARPWLAFGACSAIWGSTFLAISFGNDALAPVWAATLRLVLATGLLTAWTWARGRTLPRGAALRAALGYGVTQFGINLPLLYWGETVVPSGLSAVVYGTIPLTSALMTGALGMERLTAAKVAGALVAFGGVALLFSSTLHAHVSALGLGAIFVGATAASLGTVLLKRGPRQDPFAANAVGSAIGAVMAGAASVALGEPRALPATFAAAWPLLYLTVAGSLGAYVIMSWLVNHWSVTRTAYVTVVVPVIALALGSAARHERLGATSVAGAALVLGGLLVGMRPRASRT
jgi:drug/metabolite transporter (DMT)-like permease